MIEHDFLLHIGFEYNDDNEYVYYHNDIRQIDLRYVEYGVYNLNDSNWDCSFYAVLDYLILYGVSLEMDINEGSFKLFKRNRTIKKVLGG